MSNTPVIYLMPSLPCDCISGHIALRHQQIAIERVRLSSQLELITIHELLRDRQYREFFLKTPTLPEHYTEANKPWKLIVLKQGEYVWRSKRFGTYKEAFAGLKTMMPNIVNGAINCPPLDFMPPIKNFKVKGKFVGAGTRRKPLIVTKVWKPQLTDDMADHAWCGYCRRPSIFRYAVLNRPAKGGMASTHGEPEERCIICGASIRIVSLRHPELTAQKWDVNRPKVY